jgi:hypothetical protein
MLHALPMSCCFIPILYRAEANCEATRLQLSPACQLFHPSYVKILSWALA